MSHVPAGISSARASGPARLRPAFPLPPPPPPPPYPFPQLFYFCPQVVGYIAHPQVVVHQIPVYPPVLGQGLVAFTPHPPRPIYPNLDPHPPPYSRRCPRMLTPVHTREVAEAARDRMSLHSLPYDLLLNVAQNLSLRDIHALQLVRNTLLQYLKLF